MGILAVLDRPLASKACSESANFAPARARGFTISLDTISSFATLADCIACADAFKPAGAAVAIAVPKEAVAVMPSKIW